jgi:hypothetical protein
MTFIYEVPINCIISGQQSKDLSCATKDVSHTLSVLRSRVPGVLPFVLVQLRHQAGPCLTQTLESC